MEENILGKAKAAMEAVKTKVTELREDFLDDEKKAIVEEYKEKGEAKTKELIEILNNYQKLFIEAGYDINSINASLSIPPDISISFKFLGAIDENKRSEILERAKENKMVSILIKSLFKSTDFAETIKIGQMKLKSINITLGLIPKISISIS